MFTLFDFYIFITLYV